MNKLDELIAEFCPDGVEFAKLGDCCAIEDNKRKPIKASERTTGKHRIMAQTIFKTM